MVWEEAPNDSVAAPLGPAEPVLVEVRHPGVLPDVVRQVSVRWTGAGEARAAVRACAREALSALGVASVPRVRSSPDGVPRWPFRVVGSTTHTDRFASAAVAWSCHAGALGIDTRRIVNEVQARQIGQGVAWPFEVAQGRAAGLTRLEALTLVLAAKRAVVKSLHPHVHDRRSLHDLRIVSVDARTRQFRVRLIQPASPHFPAGAVLDGRFGLDAWGIHAGVVLGGRRPETP